ncbi:uncharacterized protein EAF01_003553 [Botrytis porri]|uniref:uncharacterized protein n=1 Tax=Botrytis porri TaxID=87229 RepID=UPI0019019526|nr:uncharacterized protein EAF01_003553 [Botrytis porri]KAF7909835.1 hypothetical protein EAF01_003553 [Botrytis porri]
MDVDVDVDAFAMAKKQERDRSGQISSLPRKIPKILQFPPNSKHDKNLKVLLIDPFTAVA